MISLNSRSLALRALSLILLMFTLTACSLFGDKEETMTEAKSLPPLEVPPDLITPSANPRYSASSAPASAVTTGGAAVAAASNPAPSPAPTVQLIRDGEARWLRAPGTTEGLWPRIREFLAERGYTIAQDEPALGYIETQWRDRSETDGLVLPGTRDGIRLRLEPAPVAGQTDIHITHKSSRQVSGEWVMLEGDTREREIEMLNRLGLFLGGSVPVVQQAVTPTVVPVPGTPAPTTSGPALSPLATPVILPEAATDVTPAEKAAIDKRFKDIEDECALCRPR